MPNIFVIRAYFGKYVTSFIRGGYAGVAWLPKRDLTAARTRDEWRAIYEELYPEKTKNLKAECQLGQLERFLFEIKPGDFVITPDADTENIYYGIAEPEPAYFYFTGSDACPFRHRRKIKWSSDAIEANDFSAPFRHAIRSPLEVFEVPRARNLLSFSEDGLRFQKQN